MTTANAPDGGPVNKTAVAGYNKQADAYRRGRPTYHQALAERVAALHRGSADDRQLVELGAGTGIFSAQLVERGLSVTAVEPVAAMRAALAEAMPSVSLIDGTAERTGLPDGAAATVVASQSFHWFNYAAALDEIARILRPGGHLITVWNVRDNSVDWVQAYTAIIDPHAGETPRHHTMNWRRAIDGDTRFALAEDISFENPSPTTSQGVLDRVMSTSFIAALEPAESSKVLAKIAAIVEPLGENFDYPYVSELQAWTRIS